MSKASLNKRERGGAGIKMLITLLVLFVLGHAGFNYVLTEYQAQSFKSEFGTAVVKGALMPDRGMLPADSVKEKVRRAMASNQLPGNATMDVKTNKNVIQARVVYSRQIELIPFGIYTYDYNFDQTATPSGFLTRE